MNFASANTTPPAHDSTKQLVLFHRDFRAFTGGHLKVWDYFNHVASSPAYEPRIAFSPETSWDSTNPWSGSRGYVVEWQPEKADLLFLAGTDWRVVPEAERKHFRKPIINLIQHPRHAEPKSELRNFLKNRAVRICVSEEVAATIKATGEVNGPVFVIPNGIDLTSVLEGKSWDKRGSDVLICGLKAPELAQEVHATLADQNRTVQCLVDRIPREDYLARMSDAKITVFLPRSVEGFYLPALEGMAVGTIVICPDCIGNRGFCQDGVNCFRPSYNSGKIAAAARAALGQDKSDRAQMREQASITAQEHSLQHERGAFLRILARIDELWKAVNGSK
jgi:Glycosyl transferases group 1